jgi:hypothetical protein
MIPEILDILDEIVMALGVTVDACGGNDAKEWTEKIYNRIQALREQEEKIISGNPDIDKPVWKNVFTPNP